MSNYFKPITLSSSQIKSLREEASSSNSYKFLDVKVVIKSDSPSLLEFFGRTYRHFSVKTLWNDKESHSYYLLTKDACPQGPLLLWDEDRAYSLVKGKALPDSADIVIFSSILSKIKSHFLLHGAALSSRGKALVLSGLSGSGKTTLALELTRRGFRFFSDEIAAISRSTHLIHPFPRAIGTRESTLNLLNKIDFKASKLHHTTSGERKWIVDIEDIFSSPMAGICQGKHLILLETMLDKKSDRGYQNINIALKKIDHNLIKRLSRIEGVEYLSINSDGNFRLAVFKVQKAKNVQRAFLKVCESYDESILYRVKAVEEDPDPQQNPQLFPISRMEATLELFGNLQNMVVNDGSMSRNSSENIPQLLFELIDAIGGMECYRLLVGNLKKTADIIFDLAK